MGRQIAIVTSWPDELLLLRHLEIDCKLRLFRSIADSRSGLWIENWEQSAIPDSHYCIWPTRFTWRPKYWQIKQPCVPEVEGKWVVANDGVAPAIELSRHLHGRGSAGRLYWAKYFLATAPLSYDVNEFDRFVSAVWRWVRKQGVCDRLDAHKPYVLPNAYRRRTGGAP